MELEALEAILSDRLQEFDGNVPGAWSGKMVGQVYKVIITPDEDMASSDYPLRVEFSFAHTPQYPEEAPLTRLRSVMGLTDASVKAGQAVVDGVVEEHLGMTMIYQIISELQEWVNQKALDSGGGAKLDEEDAAKLAAEKAEEQRAAARRHGTPVTPETFEAWQLKFEAEMEEQRRKTEGPQQAEAAGRLTGKQYFMKHEESYQELDQAALEEVLAAQVEGGAAGVEEEGVEDSEEEELSEELDLDDEDEDDILDAYLAENK